MSSAAVLRSNKDIPMPAGAAGSVEKSSSSSLPAPPLPYRPASTLPHNHVRLQPPTPKTQPILSDWRRNVPMRAQNNMTTPSSAPHSVRHESSTSTSATTTQQPQLTTYSVVVPDKSKWITAIAAAPTQPWLALSSASRGNNLFLVRHAIPKGVNSSKPALEHIPKPDSYFQMTATHACQEPVFDISWMEEFMLCGCANNSVELLKVGEDGSIHTANQYAHVIHPKSVLPSPPGCYGNTNRVHAVHFQPGSKARTFLAAETCNLRIWDSERTLGPIASCKVSDSINFAASWSPTQRHLIAVGGVDRALTVVDTRVMGIRGSSGEDSMGTSPVAWFKYKAHPKGAVRALAWSPFVPYWLASAGEDRMVNVWDLRYDSGPVARIDDHYHSVESLCWSESHSELLTSGSADRHWRMWNIRSNKFLYANSGSVGESPLHGSSNVAEHGTNLILKLTDTNKNTTTISTKSTNPSRSSLKHPRMMGAQQLATCGKDIFASAVVGVAASRVCADTYFAVSMTGELTSHTISPDWLDSLAPHRFEPGTNPKERDLETFVYRREMDSATSLIVDWARQPENEEKLEEITAMLDLIRPGSPEVAWKFPPIPSDTGLTSAAIAKASAAASELGRDAAPASSIYGSTADPIDIIASHYYASRFNGASSTDDDLEHVHYFYINLSGLTATTTGANTEPAPMTARQQILEQFISDVHTFSHSLPNEGILRNLSRPLSAKLQTDHNLLQLRLQLLPLLKLAQEGKFYVNVEEWKADGGIVGGSIAEETGTEESSSSAVRAMPPGLNLEQPPPQNAKRLSQAILDHQPAILAALDADPQSLSATLLRKLVEIVMAHEYLSGLQFGRKVLESLEKHERVEASTFKFTTVASLAHLLLFPTVFDEEASYCNAGFVGGDTGPPAGVVGATEGEHKTSQDSLGSVQKQNDTVPQVTVKRARALETILRNPRQVLSMVKLEWRIHKALHKSTEYSAETPGNFRNAVRVAEEVVQLMEGVRTISVSTNRAYLQALLTLKKYLQYCDLVVEAIATHGPYDYTKSLVRHLEQVAIPHVHRTYQDVTQELDTNKLVTEGDFPRVKEDVRQLAKLMFLAVQHSETYATGQIAPELQPLSSALSSLGNTIMNAFHRLAKSLEKVLTSHGRRCLSDAQLHDLAAVLEEAVRLQLPTVVEVTTGEATVNGQQQQPPPGSPTRPAKQRSGKKGADGGWTSTFVISEITALAEKLKL